MAKDWTTKRILIFLAFAFGVPWAAALVITLSGMLAANPAQAVALANTVFISTPWLANIAARLVTREGWGNLWLRPNLGRGWPFYLAVWLLPFLATVVGGTVFYLLYPQSFDPNLSAVRGLLQGTPEAAAANPWAILLTVTLSLMFIASLINMVASMGEEFGWRAYLLPKLVERFGGAESASGARKAALLTGLIHGVWHWPLLLMGASFVPGFSFLNLLLYLVLTIALSILVSWAVLRSGSVWPAALGHGVLNATSALPGFLLAGAAIPLVGPEPTGLIGGIGYTLLALVLFFTPGAFAGRKEAGPEPIKSSPTPVS